MLIVVVIIWILASSLIPRLTGYLARTRDLRRQTDLRNIAAAVGMYRDQYGKLPLWESNIDMYFSKASRLENFLQDYLSSVPQDPIRDNLVLIHTIYYLYKKNPHPSNSDNPWAFWLPNGRLPKWEYLYQLTSNPDRAFLVAKMETPEYANYVLTSPLRFAKDVPGWWFHHRQGDGNGPWGGENLFLCSKIEKTKQGWTDTPASSVSTDCTYSSEDELYYIVSIK